MQTQTEYVLLFILGFALYEYFLNRYFALSKKKLLPQGIVLAGIIFLLTVKYFSLVTLVANVAFVLLFSAAA